MSDRRLAKPAPTVKLFSLLWLPATTSIATPKFGTILNFGENLVHLRYVLAYRYTEKSVILDPGNGQLF